MTDLSPLDNPIWHALTTGHRDLRRSPAWRLAIQATCRRWRACMRRPRRLSRILSDLVGTDEGVGLFTTEPITPPADWQVVRARPIEQMICTGLGSTSSAPAADIAAIGRSRNVALAAATEPGPFQSGTRRMGRYYGIRSTDGQLIAMAGERLNLDGFVEISAVCTDPGHRGHGYGRRLVEFLASQILDEGKVPFLHVKSENGRERSTRRSDSALARLAIATHRLPPIVRRPRMWRRPTASDRWADWPSPARARPGSWSPACAHGAWRCMCSWRRFARLPAASS